MDFFGCHVTFLFWVLSMQNINKTSLPFLATVNPPYQPKEVLLKWSTWHLVPSVGAVKASLAFDRVQGKRGIWFSEAYHGKLKQEILGSSCYIKCICLSRFAEVNFLAER